MVARRHVNPGPGAAPAMREVSATTRTPARTELVVTLQRQAGSAGAEVVAAVQATGVARVTPVVSAITRTPVSMAPAFTTNPPAAQPAVLPGLWVVLVIQAASVATPIPALTVLAAISPRVVQLHWELEAAATGRQQVDTMATGVLTRPVVRTLSWVVGRVLAVPWQAPEEFLPS